MYSKLFSSILDSSIWLEDASTRLVWITFLAAKDGDGFARFASVENLARRAIVTVEEAQRAVAKLEAPDPQSSNTMYDGRRIERVPGGWMVLNAKFYDEIVRRDDERRSVRERVQLHRDRKRTGFDEMLQAQNQRCGCCGKPFEQPYSKYVVLDHDHRTHAKRDLVCQSCNKRIGQVENGKTLLLGVDEVVAYIARHVARGEERDIETDPFEVAWAAYPKRSGGNSKVLARKAWEARLRDRTHPATAAELLAGVERYAAYVRAKGDEGTEFVKQAATFFGPAEHWKETWDAPTARSGNGSRGGARDAMDGALSATLAGNGTIGRRDVRDGDADVL